MFYIGIGGGLMNVAIFFFLLEFPYRTSVILSLCTLMGSNVLQAAINLDKPHPLSKSRPLISWEAVLIIMPSILCGKSMLTPALVNDLRLTLPDMK